MESPVVQLVDAASGEILYTVRASGKTFTPAAPNGRTFLVKAGTNAPDTVITRDGKVGDRSRSVSLR